MPCPYQFVVLAEPPDSNDYPLSARQRGDGRRRARQACPPAGAARSKAA
jgi:hypothetical protein